MRRGSEKREVISASWNTLVSVAFWGQLRETKEQQVFSRPTTQVVTWSGTEQSRVWFILPFLPTFFQTEKTRDLKRNKNIYKTVCKGKGRTKVNRPKTYIPYFGGSGPGG